LALAAACTSGIAVFVNGEAVGAFPSPTVYTTAKNLVAGLILLAVATMLVGEPAGRPTASMSVTSNTTVIRNRPALFAVAVVGGSVPFVLFFEGLARASSTDAAFLHKTLVVWAAILAVIVLRESVGAAQVVAVGLLIAGHVVLTGGLGNLGVGTGELMILTATLCWSVEVVIVKRLLADLPASTVAAVRIGAGSVLLLGWLAATGRLDELAAFGARQWGWIMVTGPILALFVSLWFRALAAAPVTDVTAILVLGAVVTGLLDLGVGEAPVAGRLPGWLLIVAGAALVLAHGRRADHRLTTVPVRTDEAVR
jgi:drug/metabolite transporter (DMT)-like permease